MADCLFCRIVAGEIPATIVKRSDEALAFRDIDARAPVHVLVIPTKHVAAVRTRRAQMESVCWAGSLPLPPRLLPSKVSTVTGTEL